MLNHRIKEKIKIRRLTFTRYVDNLTSNSNLDMFFFLNSCVPNEVFEGNGVAFPILLVLVVYHFFLQVWMF